MLPLHKTRTTDYKKGQLLEIIETTFHDYPLGTIVQVLSSDWHSYHVFNTEGEKRYWWVKEQQVKPLQK